MFYDIIFIFLNLRVKTLKNTHFKIKGVYNMGKLTCNLKVQVDESNIIIFCWNMYIKFNFFIRNKQNAQNFKKIFLLLDSLSYLMSLENKLA